MTPLRQPQLSAEATLGLSPREEATIFAALELFLLFRKHELWPEEPKPQATRPADFMPIRYRAEATGGDLMSYDQALALLTKIKRRRLVLA